MTKGVESGEDEGALARSIFWSGCRAQRRRRASTRQAMRRCSIASPSKRCCAARAAPIRASRSRSAGGAPDGRRPHAARGLDEGVWPPQAETGAFLKPFDALAIGPVAPERRIGQSAHDFVMALGAKEVVLSRAAKRDGSPTVASRFLTRLERSRAQM